MIYFGWDGAINPQHIVQVEKSEIPITSEWMVTLYLSDGRKHERRFFTKKEAHQYWKNVISHIRMGHNVKSEEQMKKHVSDVRARI